MPMSKQVGEDESGSHRKPKCHHGDPRERENTQLPASPRRVKGLDPTSVSQLLILLPERWASKTFSFESQ